MTIFGNRILVAGPDASRSRAVSGAMVFFVRRAERGVCSFAYINRQPPVATCARPRACTDPEAHVAGDPQSGEHISTPQLRREFSFDDARAVVPYLARLGVTHLYLSPDPRGAPRQRARLRHHGPRPPERRARRRGRLRGARRRGREPMGSGSSSISCRTTWESIRRRIRGGATCSRTVNARRTRGHSTSTGGRSSRSYATACSCRSSATATESSSSAASSSSGSRTARSRSLISITTCRSTRARRRRSCGRRLAAPRR